MPGSMKTTRWEKWGLDGKENANWVGEMVMKFVRQGLLAGMTPNMTAAGENRVCETDCTCSVLSMWC